MGRMEVNCYFVKTEGLGEGKLDLVRERSGNVIFSSLLDPCVINTFLKNEAILS